MGELGITISDLDACPDCGHYNGMIFQNEKNEKYWIACGYRKCEHKTKESKELLDVADEWGLRESES
jgi:ssDNA-binding Zn-finger/Zn-ribbon topoisomerase 1